MNKRQQVQVTRPTNGTTGGSFKDGPVAYSAAQIASMCSDGGIFNGFTAESCGHCRAKANVFAKNASWFCACGHYNHQSCCYRIPHEKPDYGPSLAAIREGHEIHEQAITALIANEQPGWTPPANDRFGFARGPRQGGPGTHDTAGPLAGC